MARPMCVTVRATPQPAAASWLPPCGYLLASSPSSKLSCGYLPPRLPPALRQDLRPETTAPNLRHLHAPRARSAPAGSPAASRPPPARAGERAAWAAAAPWGAAVGVCACERKRRERGRGGDLLLPLVPGHRGGRPPRHGVRLLRLLVQHAAGAGASTVSGWPE